QAPNEYFRNLWENLLKYEQNNICSLFESLDTVKFKEEIWNRRNGKGKKIGTGITKVLENGTVFEKCAVNFSTVFGTIDREAAKQMCVNQYNKEYINTTKICHSEDINHIISKVISTNHIKIINEKYKFYASGLSIIAHPVNPNAPSIHANFRFFQIFIRSGKKKPTQNNSNKNMPNINKYMLNNKINLNNNDNTQNNINKQNVKNKIGSNYKSVKHWFGGGCDLSPCYIFPELFINFHHSFKLVCDKYNHLFYKYFKIWCDLYFRIKHRNISRGIGGIFFDNLLDNTIKNKKLTKSGKSKGTQNTKNINENNCKCYSCNDIMDKSYKIIYYFIQECIITFRNSYFYILAETIHQKYDENMINWQRICRGRYAEFNLIYDRGTKFGLELNNYKTYRRRKKKYIENVPNYSPTNYIKDEIFDDQISDYMSDEHEKIDNVLASLPLKCEFLYKSKITKFSREYETLQILKHPKKWVDY
ncbi:coproporphyrinogen III oxidase, aerobic, partial [Plasmodium yoelii yoelii]